jgi:vinculin
VALAKGIQQKLQEMAAKCARAVAATERSGSRKPAHTVAGKVEQAQRWLANPALDDKGLGSSIVHCPCSILMIAFLKVKRPFDWL